MQSSYSVIKSNFATTGEEKKISTSLSKKLLPQSEKVSMGGSPNEIIENYEELIRNYENISANILKNARAEAEKIRVSALERISEEEKRRYEVAYEEGRRNGYEDGKAEAIESVLPEAKKHADEMMVIAESVLKYANNQFEDYVDNKKSEIISMAFTIASHIMKKEVVEDENISIFIEQVLADSKGEENIIIKCNPIHEEELSNNINSFKVSYAIRGEIFILPDPNIPEGNAVVEKSSGLVEVGIDVALNIIKEEMFG